MISEVMPKVIDSVSGHPKHESQAGRLEAR